MKPPTNKVPVFALDADFAWEDLEDAIHGCTQWQTQAQGQFGPMMFFAPLTDPENPDAWEPMKGTPVNLFVVSIARHADEVFWKALRCAEPQLGPMPDGWEHPDIPKDFTGPLARTYTAMETAGVPACALAHLGKDEASFFFIRGRDAVRAFDAGLRRATAKGGTV